MNSHVWCMFILGLHNCIIWAVLKLLISAVTMVTHVESPHLVICAHMNTYKCTFTYVHMVTSVVCTQWHTFTCSYTNNQVYTLYLENVEHIHIMYLLLCEYVLVQTHTHAHTSIRTHTNTHTHTHIQQTQKMNVLH